MVRSENGWTEVAPRDVMVSVELTAKLNVAVTAWLEFIVRAQLPVPGQAPDHPANVDPAAGVAVTVITVPPEKIRQTEPHEVPGREVPTVPMPVPEVVIVRVVAAEQPEPRTALSTIWTSTMFTKPSMSRSFAGGALPSASFISNWTSGTVVFPSPVTLHSDAVVVGSGV
jgi:hypothetical protein